MREEVHQMQATHTFQQSAINRFCNQRHERVLLEVVPGAIGHIYCST